MDAPLASSWSIAAQLAYRIATATLQSFDELLVALVNSAYRGEESQKGWTAESHLIKGARTDPASVAELMNEANAVILKYVDKEGVLTGCVYLQKQEDSLYLGMLSVLPDLQGAGIGKQLLAAADAYALQNHCTHVAMTVISIRHELVGWYERHGYLRTGEMKPFHIGDRFGIAQQPLELMVLEKKL